uniref:NADH-ubiquinone oxidoreductase chain 4 n=1 Tax=Cicadella viridis TaxID=36150 RepID=A0A6B9PJ17_CICVR|nr:NADH dehydrogenase subunit 4 [Cicadella viridis]
MSIIFYLIFMIPILFFNSWFVIQLAFILIMVKFLLIPLNLFFSSISYFFGLDFISFGLIVLSLLITSLMILSSSKILKIEFYYFVFCCYVLLFCLLIVFSTLNMLVMYLFFEFSLIPLILIILGWGYQPERLISGLYLFFYTLIASLPLLLVFIYFYNNFGSLFFDFNYMMNISFYMHMFLMLAFLVKLPMYMLHFWLPKAHVYAPIAGSMILAGVLLKIGGYGIIRTMYIYEYIFNYYSYIWYSFSILGSFMVALICLVQCDIKCLIAYSSVAHMGMCLMGLITMTKFGFLGSYLMMLGHGLCSSGLFFLANVSYERFMSRSFFINKGLMLFMPSMSLMWFLFCSFNMGCPPSMNFISEVFILLSMMMYWNNSLFFIFLMSFFSACFCFYLFSFSQHGKHHNLYCYSSGFTKEYLILIVHLFPLFFSLMFFDKILI